MNITEKAIINLIKYYSLSNAAQLANKFEITQGVVSNWKTRNAIGALTDTVANKDPEALEYIFSGNNVNFSQTGSNSQQVHTQHNTSAGMVVHPNTDSLNHTNIKNEDELKYREEMKGYFDALVAVSNVLNKKDKLKEELTKLISILPTL